MAKYKIVGVEHREGTSKKTGRPYDMDVLHVMALRPSPNVIGNAVDTIPIGRESGILTCTPKPDEVWEVGFNRAGFVEEAYVVK